MHSTERLRLELSLCAIQISKEVKRFSKKVEVDHELELEPGEPFSNTTYQSKM